MTENNPSAPKPGRMQIPVWKIKRAAVFAMPLLYAGLMLLLGGSARYPTLFNIKTFYYSCVFIICFWVIYILTAAKLLKGRTGSHRELLGAAVLALLLLIGFGGSTIEQINGRFDRSPPKSHQTLIVGKYRDSSLRFFATYYFLRVKSWRKEGNELIETNAGFYEDAVPGKTSITVTTKAGWLGIEWVVTAGHL